MGSLSKIAFRNVVRHRGRSWVTVSSIAFGAAAIIFAGGFFEDIYVKLREALIWNQWGHITVYRKGYRETGRGRPIEWLIDNPEAVQRLSESVDGVKGVSPFLEIAGLLTDGESSVAFIGEGVNPDRVFMNRLSAASSHRGVLKLLNQGNVIERGTGLEAGHPLGVLLGRGLAQALGADVGDEYTLLSRTAGGSLTGLNVRVRGIYYSTSKLADDNSLKISLPAAQSLVRVGGGVTGFRIYLDETGRTAAVQTALNRVFTENGLPLETEPWSAKADFYFSMREILRRLFFVLNIVIVSIVILSIFNTVNMNVYERTVEIGTLMAMGSSRAKILRLFVAEGLILGVGGVLAGATVGTAVTALVGKIGIVMPASVGMSVGWLSQPAVRLKPLLLAAALSVVTAFFGALIPAFGASRLEIAAALRQ